MRFRSLVTLLFGGALAGCGNNNLPGQTGLDANLGDLADLGAPGDLVVAPDFASPPPDLALLPDAATPSDLSGLDLSTDLQEVTMPHGSFYRFVINGFQMPQSRFDHSIDLNGDSKIDNQLGNIVGALGSQNIDVQAAVDSSVTSGNTLHLLKVQTVDATLTDDSMVGATFYAAQPQSSPDFSGNGTFVIDVSKMAGQLDGALVASKFSSNNPVITQHPVSMTLLLPLFGDPPIAVTLNGAHIKFVASTSGLMSGEIHGSIKNSDVQGQIVPALAARFDLLVTFAPSSPSAQQLLTIFDVGDGNGGSCTNPDGSKAQPNDGHIGTCEVAMNSIIQNVLAPDVDIFDSNGNYAPNKANTNKDSLSVGIGFTAVVASF